MGHERHRVFHLQGVSVMIDRGIIEAAYLTGFEPSAEDLTEAALFEEAQAYLTNISFQF